MANIGKLTAHIGADTKGLVTGLASGKRALSGFAGMATKALAPIAALVVGTGGIMALVGIMKSATEAGTSFEKTMATVGGVMRATAREQDELTKSARLMGETTEYSATQAAEALQFLGMAGFAANKAIAALPGTLDLATAGGLDLGRAADIATNALTAMGLEVEELGRVNDVFVGTITRSNTNMEMMAESFKYAAPLARAYGYSVEELSGLIGTLGNAGIQGCYDDETEVLTARGWLPWADVIEDDEFATRNPKTGMIEYQKASRLVRYHHKGRMYLVQNRAVDLCVTPDHRMWVKRRGHIEFAIMTAEEVDGKNVSYEGQHGERLDGSKFPCCSKWIDYDGEVFCAEVPNHLLIVRRNGKVIVSGNSMAGTQLAMAFLKANKIAKEFGFTSSDLIDVLDSMRKAGFTAGQVIEKFGGRAGRAAGVLFEATDAARAFQERLGDVGGEAKTLADTMRDTMWGIRKELTSVVESLKLDMFKQWEKELKSTFESIIGWIRENKDEIVLWTRMFVEGVSAIVSVLKAVIGYLEFISGLIQAMPLLWPLLPVRNWVKGLRETAEEQSALRKSMIATADLAAQKLDKVNKAVLELYKTASASGKMALWIFADIGADPFSQVHTAKPVGGGRKRAPTLAELDITLPEAATLGELPIISLPDPVTLEQDFGGILEVINKFNEDQAKSYAMSLVVIKEKYDMHALWLESWAGKVSGAMSNAFDDFFFDALTGKFKSLSDYLNSFLNSIARIVSQKMATSFVEKLIPGFQHGGIVTQPTLAMVGEAGPEAIIPLDRLRSIQSDDGEVPMNVTVNVNTPDVGSFKSSQTQLATQISAVLTAARRNM